MNTATPHLIPTAITELQIGDCIAHNGMLWPITDITGTGDMRRLQGRVSMHKTRDLGEFGPTVDRLIRDYER